MPLGAAAQDPELQPLLLMTEAEGVTGGEASSLQMFRIPVSFTLRSPEKYRWGLRLHLPVTLAAHDLQASTSLGDLAERVETVTVAPGCELLLRLEDWTLKPFIELGVTASSGSGTDTLYSIGIRVRGDHVAGRSLITTGVAARYTGNRSHRARIDDYTAIELGADIQRPLRYRLGKRQIRAGGYAVVRYFPDLDLPSSFSRDLGPIYEVGLSFSTLPVLRLYKLELPWIGVGYRFGELFDGIRVSFSFPF
jgi:hypothetical protein